MVSDDFRWWLDGGSGDFSSGGFRSFLIFISKRTGVVISSMFVYCFVHPDLRVEIFFKKEGTAENGGIDFELGDIGTSANWY